MFEKNEVPRTYEYVTKFERTYKAYEFNKVSFFLLSGVAHVSVQRF